MIKNGRPCMFTSKWNKQPANTSWNCDIIFAIPAGICRCFIGHVSLSKPCMCIIPNQSDRTAYKSVFLRQCYQQKAVIEGVLASVSEAGYCFFDIFQLYRFVKIKFTINFSDTCLDLYTSKVK